MSSMAGVPGPGVAHDQCEEACGESLVSRQSASALTQPAAGRGSAGTRSCSESTLAVRSGTEQWPAWRNSVLNDDREDGCRMAPMGCQQGCIRGDCMSILTREAQRKTGHTRAGTGLRARERCGGLPMGFGAFRRSCWPRSCRSNALADLVSQRRRPWCQGSRPMDGTPGCTSAGQTPKGPRPTM